MTGAILTYHSLDDGGSVISVAPEIFARQMQSLADAGIPVVPLEDLRHGVAPQVAITFDDGYRNLLDHAVPVLERLGFPATVFAVSDWCGRDSGWPSQPPAVPRRPLLDRDALRAMGRAGWQIGSHTCSHPQLTTLDDAALERELADSRACLEEALGTPVESFAYPYGTLDARVRAAAARHFELACGTRLAYLDAGDDPFDLPRLDMYYFRAAPDLSTLFAPARRSYVALRAMLRACRARVA